MLANLCCNLQGSGCAARAPSACASTASPTCSQPRKHRKAISSANVASAVLALEPTKKTSRAGPVVLEPWKPGDNELGDSFFLLSDTVASPASPETATDDSQLDLQQLSMELSQLMAEVEEELHPYLGSGADPPTAQQPQHSQQTLPSTSSSQPSELDRSAASPRLAYSPMGPSSATASTSAPSSASSEAAAAAAWRQPAPAPADFGLSLLTPAAAAAAATGEADGVAAEGAETTTAQRRRQHWRQAGPARVKVKEEAEAKFKATGNNPMAMLMGSFTKDSILSAADERALAAAAQDYMQLGELMRVLRAVLRRPPSLAEMAETLRCSPETLKTRLDCGNHARYLLASKNYRLVVSLARRALHGAQGASRGGGGGFGSGGASGSLVAMEDVVSAGMDGLMHALRKFKPEAGFRLSTYATWWIRQYVGRFLRSQLAVFNLPTSIREKMNKMQRVRGALRARANGTLPTPEELAAACGYSVKSVLDLMSAERSCAGARSLEAPVYEEGTSGLADYGEQDAEEDDAYMEGGGSQLSTVDSEEHFAISGDLAGLVERLLASLDAKDAEAVRREYGLDPLLPAGVGGVVRTLSEQEDEAALEAATCAAIAEAEAAAAARAAAEAKKKEQSKGGVIPGAQRLKLDSPPRRPSAARAIKALRATSKGDRRLADWLEAKPGNIVGGASARNAPGYTKKS